jgi:hypothetical protein
MITINIIVIGKIIAQRIKQKLDRDIPIISPNELVYAVIAFKNPFIKNSFIPSIAIVNKI